jgi:hypothetical protein
VTQATRLQGRWASALPHALVALAGAALAALAGAVPASMAAAALAAAALARPRDPLRWAALAAGAASAALYGPPAATLLLAAAAVIVLGPPFPRARLAAAAAAPYIASGVYAASHANVIAGALPGPSAPGPWALALLTVQALALAPLARLIARSHWEGSPRRGYAAAAAATAAILAAALTPSTPIAVTLASLSPPLAALAADRLRRRGESPHRPDAGGPRLP